MEQKDKFDQLEAENQELLALTKQAFVKREVEKESVPVDEEWEKFAAEHADELEALEKDEPRTATIKKLMEIVPYKVAAGIIGILFTVGVAFAAIHIVRMVSNPKPQTMQAEQTISAKPTSALPTDTVKTDTTTNAKPIVFDNVALDKMLPQIASYYNKEVEFLNAYINTRSTIGNQDYAMRVWMPYTSYSLTAIYRIGNFKEKKKKEVDTSRMGY